jgi:hypothetical protein
MVAKFGLAVAAFGLGLGLLGASGVAQAHHNDWAAPLVGGALGGYALGTVVSDYSHKSAAPSTTYVEEPAPVYYTPAPTPVYVPPPSTASIEARLKQLDALAAGGYITPQEYQTRRTQILNGA